MRKEVNDLMDDLEETKVRLNFLLRAFAVFSSPSVDEDFRPTDFEAYQGAMLGQDLVQKILDRTEEALKDHLSKVS